MKKLPIAILYFLCLTVQLHAQKEVKLAYRPAEDVKWSGTVHSEKTNILRLSNIAEPSILIYSPKKEINTGTAVVIAPGGGLRINSIESEGTMVADWLVKKGVTAIVLKYRLVPSEKGKVSGTAEQKEELLQKVFPYAISDALSAIDYVRKNAADLGVDPTKIGMMGFSAGGAVTMGVAYNYKTTNRPDFLVPIYPWTSKYSVRKPQDNEPPMLIVCATNDPLDLAMGSIHLYTSWKEMGFSVALHMYAKGGHGFGMLKRNTPSDTWIERFYDWALSEKLIVPISKVE
ncbi:alpha/beta hydrolase [Ochrovirga pacifica]|uniref:Acetyl xylan esterase n=1 Tax=Ochrovirga pacifica TaxID=1042376 RepID=A0A481PB18_9FLAO|nr:alpha/beta hydrolase [Ochrovirga pacifica]QAX24679.1 acetyl xylan esterase [Ochrovirga pacifica]